MLPYLKKNKEASVAVPAETMKRKSDSGEDYDVMDSASQDLHDAVHAGDIKGISAALRAAHELHKAEQEQESAHE